MRGNAYLGVHKNDDGIKTHCKDRAERILCRSGCSKKCEKQSKMRKCSLINEQTRKVIFDKFWKQMDWSRNEKRIYAVNLIEKSEVAQRTTEGNSRRNFSNRYHLWQGNEWLPVCKGMFTSTLGISEKTIHNWINDANCGVPKSPETPGPKKTNAINKERRQSAVLYLESLPKVPLHYCRASTSKQYLEPLFSSLSDV